MMASQTFLEISHNNRPAYLHPKLVKELSEHLIVDIANMVAYFVSPAIEPVVAIRESKRRQLVGIPNDLFQNFVRKKLFFRAYAYIYGIACTNPYELFKIGIDPLLDVDEFSQCVVDFILKNGKSGKNDNAPIMYEMVLLLKEPFMECNSLVNYQRQCIFDRANLCNLPEFNDLRVRFYIMNTETDRGEKDYEFPYLGDELLYMNDLIKIISSEKDINTGIEKARPNKTTIIKNGTCEVHIFKN